MTETAAPGRLDDAFRAADALLDTAERLIEAAADTAASAAANAFDMTLGGGVADLTPLPRAVIDQEPQRTVYRYLHSDGRRRGAPVLARSAAGGRCPLLRPQARQQRC